MFVPYHQRNRMLYYTTPYIFRCSTYIVNVSKTLRNIVLTNKNIRKWFTLHDLYWEKNECDFLFSCF